MTGRDTIDVSERREPNRGCALPRSTTGLCSRSYGLFTIASMIALDQGVSLRSALRVTHWQQTHVRDAGLSCVFDSAPRGNPDPRYLIIPPTMMNLPNPDVPAVVVRWLRNRHAAGAILVSVCSGAFILAATGLAAGRLVSTHRICAEALAQRFPRIIVDANQRIIDHGDIITAGEFWPGSTLACFSLKEFWAGPCGPRRRGSFFPIQPQVGRFLDLLLLSRTATKLC